MVQKSIIIDFDHTIGYFNQLIFLINIIEVTYDTKLTDTQIHALLDHYPYVFRPKIYDIFELVLLYEKDTQITFFILYTCNNQPRFVQTIVHYLEEKLKEKNIFHHIIFEQTKVKNINTLMQYIQREQTHSHILCFIDDTLFDYSDSRIQTRYIKSENYIYNYDIKEIVRLFPFHIFQSIDQETLCLYFKHKKSKKHKLPYKMYELNSSFILHSIHDFMESQPVL